MGQRFDEPTVIICGAGPVGLGCALELARFGVRSVLIEKHPATSWHPKTRNFNTRTMEIARGWGQSVYERLRAVDTPPGWKSPIRFLDTATGTEFGHIDSLGFEGPGPDVSPALPVMSSQDYIETIMLDAVRASGLVDVRFETELTKVVRGGEQDAMTVEIEIRGADGRTETLSGVALVAADGASSTVRAQLAIEMEGVRDITRMVNCYFFADIERHLAQAGVLFFVANPGARGVLQPLDARGRWLCQINAQEEEWSREHFTDERVAAWVRAAVGTPDLDVDVRSVGFWRLNATVAERFVQGRVVLCGDAAHQFPPTGGLGVNTGLQGAHNVMWKLALFAKSQANWSLVETYEAERRPVAKTITMQSLENSANVGRIQNAMIAGDAVVTGLTADQVITASRRYGNHLGAEFGCVYRSDAVVSDGSAAPVVADSYSDYEPSATPGARAPHVTLGSTSTIDLVGAGFTVFVGGDADEWELVARRVSAAVAPRAVAVYRVGSPGLADVGQCFSSRYGIDDSGAVLVRPDGHVAWRCAVAPPLDGAAVLLGVLTSILLGRQ